MKASVYSPPRKSRRLEVIRKTVAPLGALQSPSVVEVGAGTECHVTPPEVAARMVDYLELSPDLSVLEPSAGTGNIIDALKGHKNITAVELNYSLCKILRNRINPIQQCFLEYAAEPRSFDRVIMNPPFKKIKAHINAALNCLAPGGLLIALVPITYDGGEVIETLSNDTFAHARVNTKIVRIYN